MTAYSNMINQVQSQYSITSSTNTPLNKISGSSSIGQSGITDVSGISIHDCTSKCCCGINTGSCWGWGAGSNGPFSAYINDTTSVSFGDSLKSYFNVAAASNPFQLLNNCVGAASTLFSLGGTAGNFLSNISSSLGSGLQS